MFSDPFVIFLLIIGLGFLVLEGYLGYLRFTEWYARKWKLFKLGIKLILGGEDKRIKAIGWATLRLVLWEDSEDEPKKE